MLLNIELSLQNVGQLYEFMRMEKNDEAVQKCLRFVDLNSSRLIQNEDIFMQLPYNLINDICLRDSFFVKEIDLFAAIYRWYQKNKTFSKKEVFKNIRWNLMKAEEFAIHVSPKKIISDREYFDSLKNDKRERIATISETNDSMASDQRSRTSAESAEDVESTICDEEVNLMNLSLQLCQTETLTQSENGTRAVDFIMKMIKRRVAERNFDYLTTECLVTLRILMSENSLLQNVNCDQFFLDQGVALLLQCFNAFISDDETQTNSGLLLDLLQLMVTITELEQREFRSAILVFSIFEQLAALLTHPSVSFTVKYFAAYLLLVFADYEYLQGPADVVNIEFLDAVQKAVETWHLEQHLSLDYFDAKHLSKLIAMANRNTADVYRLYALWVLTYVTGKNVEKYSAIISKNEAVSILNKLNSQKAKNLGDILLQNYQRTEPAAATVTATASVKERQRQQRACKYAGKRQKKT